MDLIHYQLDLIDRQNRERKYLITDLLARSPLFGLAIAFMAGVVTQDKLDLPGWLWLGAAGACALFCLYLLFKCPARVFYILAAVAAVTFLGAGAMRVKLYKQPGENDIRFAVDARTLATVEGIIVSEPQITAAKEGQDDYFQERFTSTSFYLDLKLGQTETGPARVSGRVRVQVGGLVPAISPGDRILMYCWLDTIKPPANPGQFDSKTYLARRNVFVAAFVESSRAIKILEKAKANSFYAIRQHIKAKALTLLIDKSQAQTEPENMLAALILGARSDIAPAMIDAFRRTGLLHILALSGGHVALLAAIVFFIARAVGLSRVWRGGVCAIFIILFTLAVPAYSPILRASIIGLFFCISLAILRSPNALNTLSLSAICLIMYNPLEFYEPSWQLSFGCVLGMILFTADIKSFLHTLTGYIFLDKNRRDRQGVVMHFGVVVISALAAGSAAVVVSMPILAYHFYNFTPLAAIWTVVTIPVVAATMLTGFLTITFSMITPTLGHALSAVSQFFAWLFGITVKAIASIDHTQVCTGAVSLWMVVVFCAMLLFMRFAYIPKHWIKTGASCGCILIIVIGAGMNYYTSRADDALELTVFSVGHGQSVIAKFPDGKVCLFDCGSLTYPDIGKKIILPYLNQNGITYIDEVFISHCDIDHSNGLDTIAPRIKPSHINCDINQAQSSLTETLFNNNLKILWPVSDSNTRSLTHNDKSLVFLIEFAGKKILLCSDIETYAQNRIAALYPMLKADIVIMPHHGSNDTIDLKFIEMLKPAWLFYSCGKSDLQNAAVFPIAKAYFTPVSGAITAKITHDSVIIAETLQIPPVADPVPPR